MIYPQLVHSDARELLAHVPDSLASLIYIDPPWNSSNTKENSDKDIFELYLHTALHSKSILSPKGVIVWHANSKWCGRVRNILESIFSPDRFVTEIILEFKRNIGIGNAPTPNHTTLLIFSKSDKFTYKVPNDEIYIRRFKKIDDTGRPYILADITMPVIRPSQGFEWRGSLPPKNRSWRYSFEKLEELLTQGRIEIQQGRQPRLRCFLDEAQEPGASSVWRESMDRSIEKIIDSYTEINDVIIDPFCGLGITLVSANKLERRWIGGDLSIEKIQATKIRLERLESIVKCGTSLLSESCQESTARKISELLKHYSPITDVVSSDTHTLVNSHESDILEFKQTLSLCLKEQKKMPYIEEAALKTIAAFLNTRGGTLLIGVTDTNDVLGIKDEVDKLHKGSQDKFLLHYVNLLKDNVGPAFYPLIQESIVKVDTIQILRVDVSPANEPCFVGKDEKFYVRRNPATAQLGGSDMVKFIVKRFPNIKTEKIDLGM